MKQTKVYCESCIEAAMEQGPETDEEAYDFLEIASYMIPDHECDHVTEPEIECHCEGHK